MTDPIRDDEVRKTRHTGSTMAAYMGYSPWDSPLEAWEVAMGYREFLGNDDTEAGQFMEESIAKLTAHKLGIPWEKMEQMPTVKHPDYPEVFAVTPDYVVPGDKIGIQIKNHAPWAYQRYKGKPQTVGRWDNALVPVEKLIQCHLELEVVSKILGPEGWDMWFLASFFGGSNLRIYWIRRDTRTIRALMEYGEVWWLRHLCPEGPQDPPAPDCDCGACGQGRKWWVGPYKKPDIPLKLTREEKAYAPIPFADVDESPIIKTPFGEE